MKKMYLLLISILLFFTSCSNTNYASPSKYKLFLSRVGTLISNYYDYSIDTVFNIEVEDLLCIANTTTQNIYATNNLNLTLYKTSESEANYISELIKYQFEKDCTVTKINSAQYRLVVAIPELIHQLTLSEFSSTYPIFYTRVRNCINDKFKNYESYIASTHSYIGEFSENGLSYSIEYGKYFPKYNSQSVEYDYTDSSYENMIAVLIPVIEDSELKRLNLYYNVVNLFPNLANCKYYICDDYIQFIINPKKPNRNLD